MPSIFLSPSTQEFNPYLSSKNEEYYMNLLADDLEPYLYVNGINFDRNDRNKNASAAIKSSNSGDYDLHIALHSNAAPESLSGDLRGIDIYYYPGSKKGKEMADILVKNLKSIYPLPQKVRALPSVSLGEVKKVKAPSVFLELGYHDNEKDEEWLISNLPLIAEKIALSLTEYFNIPFKSIEDYRPAVVSTSSGGLNLRSAPSVASKIIGTIPSGTKIYVKNIKDGWYKTSYNGKSGYVSSSYLDIQN